MLNNWDHTQRIDLKSELPIGDVDLLNDTQKEEYENLKQTLLLLESYEYRKSVLKFPAAYGTDKISAFIQMRDAQKALSRHIGLSKEKTTKRVEKILDAPSRAIKKAGKQAIYLLKQAIDREEKLEVPELLGEDDSEEELEVPEEEYLYVKSEIEEVIIEPEEGEVPKVLEITTSVTTSNIVGVLISFKDCALKMDLGTCKYEPSVASSALNLESKSLELTVEKNKTDELEFKISKIGDDGFEQLATLMKTWCEKQGWDLHSQDIEIPEMDNFNGNTPQVQIEQVRNVIKAFVRVGFYFPKDFKSVFGENDGYNELKSENEANRPAGSGLSISKD